MAAATDAFAQRNLDSTFTHSTHEAKPQFSPPTLEPEYAVAESTNANPTNTKLRILAPTSIVVAMSYTKDYYATLNLPLPRPSSPTTSTADIRRAYKLALLGAHPDKQTGQARSAHTVDEVREAYAVLMDAEKRRAYDEWVVRNGGVLGGGSGNVDVGGGGGGGGGGVSQEFLAGLEVLDLSDFCVLDPRFEFGEEGAEGEGDKERGDDEEGQMEWTRACRCGDENGFRILEEELEDAEQRGEGEVLVGCGGCSLWVRVGFGREGE
ncbi:hypothetical protein HBI53_065880 [Parastagonospora nodorum]|nr:hypothetical protein HBI53_065880 [Parastagonospora nodorum]